MHRKIPNIGIDEMVGKTVKASIVNKVGDNMLIAFTDGTVMQFFTYFEDNEAYISEYTFLDVREFSSDELELAIGDLHPNLVDERRVVEQRIKQNVESVREAHEIAEYERLKKKFEENRI